MIWKHKELLQNQSFKNYVYSVLLAMLGNGLTYIVMIWVLLEKQTSVTATAILMTAFWLPSVIFGPLAGVFVDRFCRWRSMISAGLLRGSILILFPIVFWHSIHPFALYALAAVMGGCLAFYIPLNASFIREIIDEKDLSYGNATIDMATELGAVVGMGSAGLMLAFTSVSMCFIINGLTYFLSTWFIYKIKNRKHAQPNENIVEKKTPWQDFILGLRYIRGRYMLALVYTIQAIFFICYMTTPVLLGPFAKGVLHASVSGFGFLEAALSIGIVIGGILCPIMADKFGLKAVILFFSAVGLLCLYEFSHTHSLHLAVIFHFGVGLSFAVWALILTWAQELTDIKYQGRVHSFFNSITGVAIIYFYFFLGSHNHTPVEKLYWLELGLLVVAIFFVLLAYLVDGNDDVEISSSLAEKEI